jgi:hypothetical protein
MLDFIKFLLKKFLIELFAKKSNQLMALGNAVRESVKKIEVKLEHRRSQFKVAVFVDPKN